MHHVNSKRIMIAKCEIVLLHDGSREEHIRRVFNEALLGLGMGLGFLG